MKTLVGTPDPEPQPQRPEIVYCVTDLGPADDVTCFTVPAQLGPVHVYGDVYGNSASATTTFTFNYGGVVQ